MTGLERRYRRLLLAYPGSYRRRHGDEITTTLLELAEAGGGRPPRRQAWQLLAGGLRQRFRLPARRPLAWLGAVLAAVTLAAFGAAAGSWLASATQAGLPGDDSNLALVTLVAGRDGERAVTRSPSPWAGRDAFATARAGADWTAEPARQRLQALGWHTEPGTVTTIRPLPDDSPLRDALGPVSLPTTTYRFLAERDGLTIQVFGSVREGSADVSVDVWPTATPLRWPLVIAGLLAGALAGWLVAAALAYRLRAAGPARRRAGTALFVLGLVVLAAPAEAFFSNLARMWRDHGRMGANFGPEYTVHSALTPGNFYTSGPPWLVLALTVAGASVLVAAIALTLARRAAGRAQVAVAG